MEKEEVLKLLGESDDWERGLDVSIDKWRRFVEFGKDNDYRGYQSYCGLCLIAKRRYERNLNKNTTFLECRLPDPNNVQCPLKEENYECCKEFDKFCNNKTKKNAEKMLKKLIKLRDKLKITNKLTTEEIMAKLNENAVIQINSMPIYDFLKRNGEMTKECFINNTIKSTKHALEFAIEKLKETGLIEERRDKLRRVMLMAKK